MKKQFEKFMIYEFSDDEIVVELCKRIKAIRLSCCYSQQEFADMSGVSIVTIKRIESLKIRDITICTLLKIMRFGGVLEGIVDTIVDLPPSPFLISEKTGRNVKRFNSKRKVSCGVISTLVKR